MQITITGDAGSGKTTVGKMLAKKLNYQFYSLGQLARKQAKRRKITLQQWNELCKKNPAFDKIIDSQQQKLAKKDKIVIDSRLGWKYLPKSYKIYLKTNINTAAKRILSDRKKGKRKEEKADTLKQVVKELKQRENLQKRLYSGTKPRFDLVLDTTRQSTAQTLKIILKNLSKEKP